MSRHQLIKGTLILSIAGFTTRFIGFFYRIFLSNTIGTINLGLYQLIFPVYGICYTIYGSGIQTAISKLTAENKDKNNSFSILKAGIILSICLSISLSFLLYSLSLPIASHLLNEKNCAHALRILALVFPFCGITACTNGYYYGIKNTHIPAISQLFEQISRVLCVFLCITLNLFQIVTCEIAVIGLVIGEIISCCFNLISLKKYISTGNNSTKNIHYFSLSSNIKNISSIAVSLTSTRLIVSFLGSVEAILIPHMLRAYGLSHTMSVSIYGILTGMSLVFIMFPSTITNSLAVVLLPTISEDNANNNKLSINKTTSSVLFYCILIGILSVGIFVFFGNALGVTIFNNATAGEFITILAWLCPFLYISTTLSSILNGLGKTNITFINSTVCVTIRILFVLFFIPVYGIKGYLIGLLISTIAIALLDFFAVKKYIQVKINAANTLLKPIISVIISGFLSSTMYKYIFLHCNINAIFSLFIVNITLICFYIILLTIFDVLPKNYR